jgi:2-polyprenyl-3-methyl-5-hydroxy-6-metoxy-1,4-benzoquinol methylase
VADCQSKDEQILASWQQNAAPWCKAVQEQQIESRRLVTDQAIIAAVVGCRPQTVMDLGCGEGWLVRRLLAAGIDAQGVDAVAELLARARQAGAGNYRQLSYEQLADCQFGSPVDAVICNFSLLGDSSVEQVFAAMPRLLKPAGVFIVQTLHPLQACGEYDYQDGWRPGSWQGFSSAFVQPAPWYFRTMDSWQALFSRYGFADVQLQEPCYPASGKPASVIFMARFGDDSASARIDALQQV